MSADYILGLDLGQTKDFTALAVLERQPAVMPGGKPEYALRHLKRFPLGTAYTDIVPAMAALRRTQALRDAPLVVDQTGVGRAVVDMLRQSAGWVVPATITGGHAVTRADDGTFHVPKKELVTALQVVMQSHRLQIARGLPDAPVLVRELQQFQVKITAAANERFGVWRDGQHDDLVLAVALACWWAERTPPFEAPTVMPIRDGSRLFERMARGQSKARQVGLFGLGRPQGGPFL
jgi:hypothetical protein